MYTHTTQSTSFAAGQDALLKSPNSPIYPNTWSADPDRCIILTDQPGSTKFRFLYKYRTFNASLLALLISPSHVSHHYSGKGRPSPIYHILPCKSRCFLDSSQGPSHLPELRLHSCGLIIFERQFGSPDFGRFGRVLSPASSFGTHPEWRTLEDSCGYL